MNNHIFRNNAQKRIVTISVLLFIVSALHATYIINITPKTGTPTTINLATVQNLTFSGGNMVVNQKDASVSNFLLKDIVSLSFSNDYTTGDLSPSSPTFSVKAFLDLKQQLMNVQLELNSRESAQMDIVGLDGKVALKSTLKNSSNTISISTLNKGVYICRIRSGAVIKTTKFIIQ